MNEITIKEAFEERGIECKECGTWQFELTYNNTKYYVMRAYSTGLMFSMFNITEQKQICTRANFRTIIRLIKLGHR